MPISFSDVDEILRIIDLYPAAEVRFEHGDVKLYVKRAGVHDNHHNAAQPSIAPSVVAPSPESPAAAPKPARAQANPDVDRTGQIAVESPLTGVFYAAPSPSSPPFVVAGQTVHEGADLCIIEVMKLMNVIKSPVRGEIVDVIAQNGMLIERGASVMWIRPAR
jgi:acetyl-CoA carboxylase biotin carboxyl carrier protein